MEGAVLLAMLLMIGWGGMDRAAVRAADPPHEGMSREHGDMQHGHGERMEALGERLFLGKTGPWNLEARLIDVKARLEQQGVSAKVIGKLKAWHHLMVILTDPMTGKPVTDVMGEVVITGPDTASHSKVTLVVMGAHIGADVALPHPGKYAFRVSVMGGGKKGDAVFDYKLKK
jgi:hypothetical protein